MDKNTLDENIVATHRLKENPTQKRAGEALLLGLFGSFEAADAAEDWCWDWCDCKPGCKNMIIAVKDRQWAFVVEPNGRVIPSPENEERTYDYD